MKYILTAIIFILSTALSQGQGFPKLHYSVSWWYGFYASHHKTDAFSTYNATNVSSIVLLIHEICSRGSWVILRDGEAVSTNMPTAVYFEGGRQRVLVSSKAVDFLCAAPAETNNNDLAGLAIYCTSNSIVKGFRGLSWHTLKQVPDAQRGFALRVYEDRLEKCDQDTALTFPWDSVAETVATNYVAWPFKSISFATAHHQYYPSFELKEKSSENNAVTHLLRFAAINEDSKERGAKSQPFYPLREKDEAALLISVLKKKPLEMFAFDNYEVRDRKIADLLSRLGSTK